MPSPDQDVVTTGQWGAMTVGGGDYDPNSEEAIARRAKGLCGYCGHKAHWKLAGCQVCGPERCPVVTELSPEQAVHVADLIEADAT